MDSSLQIVEAIGDMKESIQRDLGLIKVEIAKVVVAHEATIARVNLIEDEAAFRKKVNTVFMVGIVPVMGFLHQLATWLHLIR